MEGPKITHLHKLTLITHSAQAFPDLPGRFVGKGENHHILTIHAAGLVQVLHLGCKHRGLAASHIGVDKAGAAVVKHRLSLIFIQFCRQYLFLHENPHYPECRGKSRLIYMAIQFFTLQLINLLYETISSMAFVSKC